MKDEIVESSGSGEDSLVGLRGQARRLKDVES